MIFRFDDVCSNDSEINRDSIKDIIREAFPDCQIIYAVSPLIHEKTDDERVFPKIWNAYSDHRVFYKMGGFSVPDDLPLDVDLASHGMWHCDHRLLTKEVQEASILTSCSLVGADIFVPPFNKWNKDTESICKEHKIELVKWEDGWLCAEHNPFYKANGLRHRRWYLHAREFTPESFKAWLES